MHYRRYRSDKQIKTQTSDIQVKLRKVPFGFVLEVTHFTALDMTTIQKKQELGYVDMTGVDRILSGMYSNWRYPTKVSGPCWIEEGETPYGKVYSPTNADVFIVSCHGRLWPKKEVRVADAKVQQKDNLPDISQP